MVDKEKLASLRKFDMPYFRRDIKACDEDSPIKATNIMLELAIAYKGDYKTLSKDPLYEEIGTLLTEFRDTCACTKFTKKEDTQKAEAARWGFIGGIYKRE